ncbi:MAG: PAS domain-containing protein, partial [Caldilineaceae bacterium]|nr:PAS domain-containing protein [Caldilineaceae bacterium]
MLLIEPEDGSIIRANRAAVDFYGYSRSQLESITIQQINTFTSDQVKEERLRAAREHRNFFIFRHRLADDSIRRVEVFSNPIAYRGRTVLWST